MSTLRCSGFPRQALAVAADYLAYAGDEVGLVAKLGVRL